MPTSFFKLNLRQVIYALSDALDLVGVTNIHHGKRVAYMSHLVAKNLNWSNADLDELFQASILHDCGVSQTNVHAKLTQLQWEEESNHCEIGAELLKQSTHLRHLSEVIKYHHTHWRILKDLDIPEHIKRFANCIYMVDRIDVLTLTSTKGRTNVLLGTDDTIATINRLKNSWFNPELVESFNEIAASEAFWLGLEDLENSKDALAWVNQDQRRDFSFNELKQLIKIFSSIVDAKSSFTREHSQGVGALARYIGNCMNISKTNCDMLEIAGLLHDIGKLRTPDDYLEKPSKLTDEEFAMLRRHSFDTYKILQAIDGLEDIAMWASQHHEHIDGSGYPKHLKESELSQEARILAVADVFQALAQNRPYRAPLEPEEILNILQKEVEKSHLDESVVNCVSHHLEDCWRTALLINKHP